MAELKQSTAFSRAFLMIQSADHITGLTGASPKLNLSMACAAFQSTNAVITEIGNGYYKAALTSTDTRTLGDLAFTFSAASADPTDFIDQVRANILGDTLPASVAGTVTSGTVLDKTGYALSQAFPSNFAALGILAGGQVGVDWGNVANKATANALAGTTLNSSMSVITSAPVTVGTNNDKTGYTASTVTDKTGYTVSTVSDKTGYALTPQERGLIVASTWTTLQTEAYAALHTNPSMAQLLYELRAMYAEKSVSGTSVTVLQIDGATPAETFTLDSTSPTKISRAA